MIAVFQRSPEIDDRPRRAWPGGLFFLMVFWTVASVVGADKSAAPDDDRPASMRGVEFWKGRAVIQVFGHVFALEDKADVATKYYWTLSDSAVGKVIECIDGNFVRVEFVDDKGWERIAVPEPKTEVKFDFDYDNYGAVESVNVSVVKKEGIRIGPRQWGRVIEEAGGRRIVEFPVECLGLQRPRVGDRVVRGPDWRAGHADGGSLPVGPLSAGDGDCSGEVTDEVDSDRYVKVRWNKTGREGFYRFDWRRYYDVEVPPPEGD